MLQGVLRNLHWARATERGVRHVAGCAELV